MKHKVTKAIFPVAGQGTRFLPATKSIPKEIMTLVDRPLVQYAIDEAPGLERSLRKKGKAELFWAKQKHSATKTPLLCCAMNFMNFSQIKLHKKHIPIHPNVCIHNQIDYDYCN